jgi:hypothetical protein
MGITYSINNKELGKSIINKIYRTKIPVSFGRSMYDVKYYVSEWEDRQSLANPKLDEFHVKLDAGIGFVIRDVQYSYSIDAGESIRIMVELLHDVKLYPDTKVAEAVMGSKSKYPKWSYTTVENAVSPELLKLLSADRQTLQIKGVDSGLFTFQFRDAEINRVDKDKPFAFKTDLLEYVNDDSRAAVTDSIVDNTMEKIHSNSNYQLLCLCLCIIILCMIFSMS